MRGPTTLVPHTILTHPGLTPNEKRLWAVLLILPQPRQFQVRQLIQQVGLSERSIRRHLKHLSNMGCLQLLQRERGTYEVALYPRDFKKSEKIPTELLLNPLVTGDGVCIWLALWRTPQASATDLAAATGFDWRRVQHHLLLLEAQGWVKEGVAQHPLQIQRAADISAVENQLLRLRQEGCSQSQALMVTMLTLLVEDDDYIVESDKKYLTNPTTGYTLRYDLHWPAHKRAFEFHGPQHFGPTKKYPGIEAYQKQRTRDLIKLGLSYEQGIKVCVLTIEDLCFERLRMVAQGLPLRDLSDRQHLIKHLEGQASSLRRLLGPIQAASTSDPT